MQPYAAVSERGNQHQRRPVLLALAFGEDQGHALAQLGHVFLEQAQQSARIERLVDHQVVRAVSHGERHRRPGRKSGVLL